MLSLFHPIFSALAHSYDYGQTEFVVADNPTIEEVVVEEAAVALEEDYSQKLLRGMSSIYQAFVASNDEGQVEVVEENPIIEDAASGLEAEGAFKFAVDLEAVREFVSASFSRSAHFFEGANVFAPLAILKEYKGLVPARFVEAASAFAPYAILGIAVLSVLALINYIQHSSRFHWVSSKDAKMMKPFCWYIALDGHYMASFSGGAGVMKIEFPSCKVTTRYYPGVSYGHAVDVSPNGRWIFLGNYSQQITIIEASTMELVARLPLTEIEDFDADTFRLKAPVFAEWLSDSEFIIAMPKNIWKVTMRVKLNPMAASSSTGQSRTSQDPTKPNYGVFKCMPRSLVGNDSTFFGAMAGTKKDILPLKAEGTTLPSLTKKESRANYAVTLSYTKVCSHNCDSPHQTIWASKTETLVLADTGSEESRPRRVELIHIPNLVGDNFDSSKVTNKVLHLQDDVWHMALDPESGTKIYTATYSKFDSVPYQVRDRSRFFSVGFERNYVYEICTEKQNVSRIFSGSVALPLHLNSDHVVANRKLLIASGSAHDGFELDLKDFATWKKIPGGPSLLARYVNFACWINLFQNILDGVTHFPFILQALFILLRTNDGRFMNGIYAMEVSPCQNYICLGHRDCNYVRLVDAKTHRTITKFFLPTTPCPGNDHPSWLQGQFVTRHGLHHSCTSEEYRPRPLVFAPVA